MSGYYLSSFTIKSRPASPGAPQGVLFPTGQEHGDPRQYKRRELFDNVSTLYNLPRPEHFSPDPGRPGHPPRTTLRLEPLDFCQPPPPTGWKPGAGSDDYKHTQVPWRLCLPGPLLPPPSLIPPLSPPPPSPPPPSSTSWNFGPGSDDRRTSSAFGFDDPKQPTPYVYTPLPMPLFMDRWLGFDDEKQSRLSVYSPPPIPTTWNLDQKLPLPPPATLTTYPSGYHVGSSPPSPTDSLPNQHVHQANDDSIRSAKRSYSPQSSDSPYNEVRQRGKRRGILSLSEELLRTIGVKSSELSKVPSNTDRANLRHTVIEWLKILFRDKVRYKNLLALQGPSAQTLVNILQELLDSPDIQEVALRQEIIITLQKLANKAEVYPSSYQVEEVIVPDQKCFMGSGGFGEIYKCQVRGQAVCVKVIRLTAISQGEKLTKQLLKEAILWAQLSHQNIVPFQGFFYYSNRPCLLSPWMSNGHINDYLRKIPSANRYLLIRDMTEGLHYLHSWGIVHGDLKGANVMVDDSGRARLTDFGISSVFDSALPHWTSLSTVASKGGSTRWQAPELLDSKDDQDVYNTIMSDVYAWACICYETFTSNLPFFEISRDATVMIRIIRDRLRPTRPPADDPTWLVYGLQEQFWSLMERCWDEDPKKRPSVDELLSAPLLVEALDYRPINTQLELGSFSQHRFTKRVQITLSTVEELERLVTRDETPASLMSRPEFEESSWMSLGNQSGASEFKGGEAVEAGFTIAHPSTGYSSSADSPAPISTYSEFAAHKAVFSKLPPSTNGSTSKSNNTNAPSRAIQGPHGQSLENSTFPKPLSNLQLGPPTLPENYIAPMMTKKKPEKAKSLNGRRGSLGPFCFNCRDRKVPCTGPQEGRSDTRCYHCARRQLTWKYPEFLEQTRNETGSRPKRQGLGGRLSAW